MKKTMRLFGALAAVCASVSMASGASAAQCQGTIVTANNTNSVCNEPGRVGTAQFNKTLRTASVNMTTGINSVARQRDSNGDRVFCGTAQVAPTDSVQGAGTSAGASQSDCVTNQKTAVSVQVLVSG
jgi:hypothetical protein